MKSPSCKIHEAFVGKGLTRKLIHIKGRGKTGVRKKRNSHLTVSSAPGAGAPSARGSHIAPARACDLLCQVKLRVRADAKATSKAAALAGAELPAKPGEPESPDRDQQ